MGGQSAAYAAIQESLHRIVAACRSFDEAVPKVLEAVCQRLDWHLGQFWLLEEATHVVRFGGSWRPPDEAELEMERLSARSSFHAGVGLPGRVVASGEPAWIRDVQRDPSFPRAPAAIDDGIRSGFAVPIAFERKNLGIVEFFSREPMDRDDELLRVLMPIGEELGRLLRQGGPPAGGTP